MFWDVFGAAGHPVRATVSDMGPLLLGRLLNLNETQQRRADDRLQDRGRRRVCCCSTSKICARCCSSSATNAKQLNDEYGNVSAASIGAIQRALLTLEEQGGDHFFGEPMLDIDDLLQTAPDGRGVVNILAAERLMTSPKLYATFLLWLLAELFENLPEVGDPDKPRMVFFFDEAHLLFSDAPRRARAEDRAGRPADSIEGRRRLLHHAESRRCAGRRCSRSWATACSTRFVRSRRAISRPCARPPRRCGRIPRSTLAAAISELAVGEALVSFLDERGSPAIVERAWVLPPASRIGPITPDERRAVIDGSVIRGHYEQAVDRESAYEKLKNRTEARQADAAPAENAASAPPPAEIPNRRSAPAPAPRPSSGGSITDILLGSTGPRGGRREGILESAARSAARSVGSGVAREIMRGVLRINSRSPSIALRPSWSVRRVRRVRGTRLALASIL